MLYPARCNSLRLINKVQQTLVLLEHSKFRWFANTGVKSKFWHKNLQQRLLTPLGNENCARRYANYLCPQGTFLDSFMTDHGVINEKQKIDEEKTLKNEIDDEQEICIQLQPLKPFKLYNLMNGPNTEVWLNRKQARLYYQQMMTIRRMELASDALNREKIISELCHLCTGQEACAVGIKAAMRDNDNVITSYRCHGWSYMMNIPLLSILAELAGRGSGDQRARGGSMLMHSPHFFGGSGILEAQVSLGAGVALSSKYKGDGGVCFALYGDDAAGQRQLFEAFNMAALWQLPIIFVCENNNLAKDSNTINYSCSANFYKHGDVVPSVWVDSTNILAVRSAATYAIDYVIRNGPLVLQITTPSNPKQVTSNARICYPPPDKTPNVRQKRDPIKLFKKLCQENGLLNQADMKSVDETIRKEFDEAVEKLKIALGIELRESKADKRYQIWKRELSV